MFAGGFEAGNVNHFGTKGVLFKLIQKLNELRSSFPEFSAGKPRVLYAEESSPGAFIYERANTAGNKSLVLMNTADHAVGFPGCATSFHPAACLKNKFSLSTEETSADLRLGKDAFPPALELAPGACHVYRQ